MAAGDRLSVLPDDVLQHIVSFTLIRGKPPSELICCRLERSLSSAFLAFPRLKDLRTQ
jgi:hypothetical protein